MTWAVESGRMVAAKREALRRPKAKVKRGPLPCQGDEGFGGFAGVGDVGQAGGMERGGGADDDEEHDDHAGDGTEKDVETACGYWRGPTFFSTKPAWR